MQTWSTCRSQIMQMMSVLQIKQMFEDDVLDVDDLCDVQYQMKQVTEDDAVDVYMKLMQMMSVGDAQEVGAAVLRSKN